MQRNEDTYLRGSVNIFFSRERTFCHVLFQLCAYLHATSSSNCEHFFGQHLYKLKLRINDLSLRERVTMSFNIQQLTSQVDNQILICSNLRASIKIGLF